MPSRNSVAPTRRGESECKRLRFWPFLAAENQTQKFGDGFNTAEKTSTAICDSETLFSTGLPSSLSRLLGLNFSSQSTLFLGIHIHVIIERQTK